MIQNEERTSTEENRRTRSGKLERRFTAKGKEIFLIETSERIEWISKKQKKEKARASSFRAEQ